MQKILLLFFLSIGFLSMAQTSSIEPDQKLLEVYPAEKIDFLLKNNPIEIALLNYRLNKGFLIIESGNPEITKISGEVVISDINNFNFLALKLIPLNSESSFYSIAGTNKVLMIKSDAEVSREFKTNFSK